MLRIFCHCSALMEKKRRYLGHHSPYEAAIVANWPQRTSPFGMVSSREAVAWGGRQGTTQASRTQLGSIQIYKNNNIL